MSKQRRWIVLIASLFGVLCLVWMFHFPYNHARLYAPIPVDAAYVGEHERLGDRWQEMAKNPLVAQGLRMAGVTDESLQDALKDKGVHALVTLLGNRRAVAAYVPNHVGAGRPIWVITSWVGGKGQLFNAGLLRAALSDFSELRLDHGRRGWVLALDDEGPYRVFTVAMVEGVMVGCVSADETDLELFVRYMDRGAARGERIMARYGLDDGILERDRGWLSLSELGASETLAWLAAMSFGVDRLDAQRIDGWVEVNVPLPSAMETRPVTDKQFQALSHLLGAPPDGLIVAPAPHVRAGLMMKEMPERIRAVGQPLLDVMDEAGVMFVSLQGAALSTRVMGIAIPSLVIGLQVKDGDAAYACVPKLVDRINAHWKEAFLPRKVEIEGRPGFVLESADPRKFMGFGPKQKPTFAVDGNWLLAASNQEVLEKVLAQPPGARGGWDRFKPQDGHALAHLWLDLGTAGADIENVLAVWSLFLKFDTGRKAEAKRRAINEWMLWLDAIRQMDGVWAGLENRGDNARLTLSMGVED